MEMQASSPAYLNPLASADFNGRNGPLARRPVIGAAGRRRNLFGSIVPR